MQMLVEVLDILEGINCLEFVKEHGLGNTALKLFKRAKTTSFENIKSLPVALLISLLGSEWSYD